jgi:hypothetical protein
MNLRLFAVNLALTISLAACGGDGGSDGDGGGNTGSYYASTAGNGMCHELKFSSESTLNEFIGAVGSDSFGYTFAANACSENDISFDKFCVVDQGSVFYFDQATYESNPGANAS